MVLEQQPTTSVEIPQSIIEEASRIADQQHWTLREALIYLANRGISAQHETERAVTEAYNAFMNAPEENRQALGESLIRSIFGQSSVA